MAELRISARLSGLVTDTLSNRRLSGRSLAARCLLTVTTTGGFSLVHRGGCTGAVSSD